MRTTLTISTILGDQQVSGDKGPLLLSVVQGIKGISMPYAYDVTMFPRDWRRRYRSRPDDRHARDHSHARQDRHVHVPPRHLSDLRQGGHERAEFRKVLQGFHSSLNGYLDFNTYMSFEYLEKMDDFKKIPYCVQYGESSLSFCIA